MTQIRDRIERNLAVVKARIAEAAHRGGREPGAVTLVAITKAVGCEEARILRDLGVTHLGENRVEVARGKIESMAQDEVPSPRWHMVGTVQRRKTGDIAGLFDTVDSIDRVNTAEAFQRRCETLDKQLDALVQVNVSGETSKHGFSPAELPGALKAMALFDRLNIQGFMTMAPFSAEAGEIRAYFATMRVLAQDHGLKELSMGMSGDFELAVEEGATQVRIGTALYA